MGNMMIPVCTERDSTCAKRDGFGAKSKEELTHKQIVFHFDDYYCKQGRKSRKKRKKTKN